CAPPMPPDPVGRLERSRARPPPAVGAGVLARAPSSARRFAGCALRDAPRPRRPARRFSAPAPSPTPAAPPRARPARELGLGFPGPILGSARLIPAVPVHPACGPPPRPTVGDRPPIRG